MGWTAAALVASAAISAGSSIYSSRKQESAQKRAEVRAREAAKRNVTVQSSGPEPTKRTDENSAAGDAAMQNARKRRQGYASTLNDRGLTSSLVGNKSILGG